MSEPATACAAILINASAGCSRFRPIRIRIARSWTRAARRGLLRLADPAEFPAVRAAALSGSVNDGDDFPREELRFGLERVLDGLEVLITRRKAAG
jgi:hypothetical protein